MPRRKNTDLRVKYFSRRLLDKLAGIPTTAATYIEAPSGYGKTTAVREWFKNNAGGGAAIAYFTAAEGEAREAAWARLCNTIAGVDATAGEKLKRLGVPDAHTVGAAAEVFAALCSDAPCYLVIDNLHLVTDLLPRPLLEAVARREGKTPHVVFLSQPTPAGSALTGSGALRIDRADFALTCAEIRAYFSAAGFALAPELAERIYQNTEGWIAAVYLTLLCHGEEMSLECAAQSIDTLLREAVWEKLNEDTRALLLPLAPFPCFTKRQLLFQSSLDTLPACALQALDCRGFLRYDAQQGVFYPHALLLGVVRRCFEELPEAEKSRIFTRAGQWNEQAHDKLAAFLCYYNARDFRSLLALDTKDVELHTAGDGAVAMIEDIIDSCPHEEKLRRPMALLSLAYELFAASRYERFLELCTQIEGLIPQTAFSQKEKDRLFGELAMIRSFAAYNDIEKMSEQHRLAYRLIEGRSQMVDTGTPWAMGCPSVLYMFHSGAGRLSHELECMERCLPDYLKLADNHGCGADLLMRAEALYMGGAFAEAEILGARAAYAATAAGQASIALPAAFLLARTALAAGDAAAYEKALVDMQRAAQAGPPSVHAAHELALAHLLLAVDRPADIAPWLKQGAFDAVGLSDPAVPYAQMLHLYACLRTGDYGRVLSLGEVFLARARAQCVLLPEIYLYALLAAAYHREGALLDAQKHLERSLALCLPDGLIVPLAELSPDVPAILRGMPREGDSAGLMEIAFRMERGRDAIRREVFSGPRPYALTAREHEIALLAAQRKSNDEIARMTCLSLATVRTHLRLAYWKMGVDSNSKNKRNLLIEKLRQ